METNLTNDYIGDISSILECPLCCETMSDPVILPCLHHFCCICMENYRKGQLKQIRNNAHGDFQCLSPKSLEEETYRSLVGELDEGVNEEICCPVCRSRTKFSSIKKDFTMSEIISKINIKTCSPRSKDQLQCHFCTTEKAEFKCLNCKSELGPFCKNAHLKIPTCKGHVVQKLEETYGHVVDVPVFCSEHTDKMVEFNCVDCNQGICYKCYILYHSHHDYEDINTALKKLIPITEHKLEPIEADIDNLDQSIRCLGALETQTTDWLERCDAQITQKMELVHSLIKNHTESFRKQLHEQCKFKIKEIEVLKKDLYDRKYTKQGIIRWTKLVLRHVKDASLLTQLQGDLAKTINQHQKSEKICLAQPICKDLFLKMYDQNLVGILKEEDIIQSNSSRKISQLQALVDEQKTKIQKVEEEKHKLDSDLKKLREDFQREASIRMNKIQQQLKDRDQLEHRVRSLEDEVKMKNHHIEQLEQNLQLEIQRSENLSSDLYILEPEHSNMTHLLDDCKLLLRSIQEHGNYWSYSEKANTALTELYQIFDLI